MYIQKFECSKLLEACVLKIFRCQYVCPAPPPKKSFPPKLHIKKERNFLCEKSRPEITPTQKPKDIFLHLENCSHKKQRYLKDSEGCDPSTNRFLEVGLSFVGISKILDTPFRQISAKIRKSANWFSIFP